MASNILLISTNRFALPDPVFPLGLAHLSAALRRAGHRVRWLDQKVDGASLEEFISRERPDLVGISLRNIDDVNIRKQQLLFDGLADLCQNIRRLAPCPVVLGGSGFSIFPERLMGLTGADYGIQGEGEAALAALLQALEGGSSCADIPGLVYRDGDLVRLNPKQAAGWAEELEEADRPGHLVEYYLRESGMLNVQTQRGCPFTCCYCTYPVIEGCRQRRRPPESVAEELARLEKQGVGYVCLVDSVFNSSRVHVQETCEAILRRNLRIKWCCFLRPAGLTPDLMRLMARAGLAHIEFGSDSFCDEVLEAYGKGFGFEEIRQASELARRENLDYCHFLICGGPGETLETLETGFRNSRQLERAVVLAVVGMRIYPGTALQERALREGVIQPETDLLRPTYYLSPAVKEEMVFEQLDRFVKEAPNWIVGDPAPEYSKVVSRLRQRGVAGPLWSYFALMQRFMSTSPA